MVSFFAAGIGPELFELFDQILDEVDQLPSGVIQTSETNQEVRK